MVYNLVAGREEDQRAHGLGMDGSGGRYRMRERDNGQFDHNDGVPQMGMMIGVMPNSGGHHDERAWAAQQKKDELDYDRGDEENRIKVHFTSSSP